MVDECIYVQAALGSHQKSLQLNEHGTRVTQRRALWAASDLPEGHIITRNDILVLRPALSNTFSPDRIDELVGKKLTSNLKKFSAFAAKHIVENGS